MKKGRIPREESGLLFSLRHDYFYVIRSGTLSCAASMAVDVQVTDVSKSKSQRSHGRICKEKWNAKRYGNSSEVFGCPTP